MASPGVRHRYECWRVSGEIKSLIRFCPDGNLERCMFIGKGKTCPRGKTISHGSRDFLKLKAAR